MRSLSNVCLETSLDSSQLAILLSRPRSSMVLSPADLQCSVSQSCVCAQSVSRADSAQQLSSTKLADIVELMLPLKPHILGCVAADLLELGWQQIDGLPAKHLGQFIKDQHAVAGP